MTDPATTPEMQAALGRLTDAYVQHRTARFESQILAPVAALEAAGIDVIVLKGPSTRLRLYGADEVRSTGDIDLLVAPARFRRATRELAKLGYARIDRHGHSDTLRNPDDGLADIDLHLTLPFVTVPPRRFFAALRDHRSTIEVDGAAITVLDPPAHTVHLAIHAAVNRFEPADRTMEEWRRGHADLDVSGQVTAEAVARTIGVSNVWDLAVRALDDAEEHSRLVADLPLWEVVPRLDSLRGALRSGVPALVRWRDFQRLVALQLGDDALNEWRADRGEGPVESGTLTAHRARLQRVATVSAKGLGRLSRLDRRPPPNGSTPTDNS